MDILMKEKFKLATIMEIEFISWKWKVNGVLHKNYLKNVKRFFHKKLSVEHQIIRLLKRFLLDTLLNTDRLGFVVVRTLSTGHEQIYWFKRFCIS